MCVCVSVCSCMFDCKLVLGKERSTDQTYKQPVEGKLYCRERPLNIVIKCVSTLSINSYAHEQLIFSSTYFQEGTQNRILFLVAVIGKKCACVFQTSPCFYGDV